MKLLAMFLALCTMLVLSQAGPINSTGTHYMGLCYYQRQRCSRLIGSFCPECDSSGNFLPQQCSGSTGYCWCVDIITGAEIPNTKTPPGSKPVNCERNAECPSGWSRFGQRCFIFISSPKSWSEAEIYCQFEGANLASIHSYEENHFIQALTRGDTHNFPESWIGGSSAIYLGLWLWCDGSKFYYENWHDDDDHDDKESERCLKMNYQYKLKWAAASCNQTLPFVCSQESY